MAKAIKIPVEEYAIQLTISKKEAEVLKAVLRLIGGDPVTSDRKYIDTISDALTQAGVNKVTLTGSNSNSVWL